jgi:hypothetical protein
LSQLVCLGRHTVAGLLCASGRQFSDWTADYRLFSRERFCKDALFDVIRRGVLAELPGGEPLVVGLDDTLLPKRGTRIPGVKWRKDPMGPPFQVNLLRAQRVLQMSAAVPQHEGPSLARMIPIDFCHAPTPAKPRKGSPAEEWDAYHQEASAANLPALAARRVRALRDKLDEDGHPDLDLWIVADGGYTNRHFLKDIPPGVIVIGRIRGDARLYYPPSAERLPGTRGRKRVYGEQAGTPEGARQDEAVPWKTVKVYAAGKVHDFRVKELAPLLWRASGATPLRLVVVAPLAYRPRKKSRLLYRKPAYLISNDLATPIEKIIQAYVWRWDVEVNFRDEKQLVGMGEAQVRSQASVESAPALAVAAYAMLLLAAQRAFASGPIPGALPAPKWQPAGKPRLSTQDLIRQLRAELWSKGLGSNFSGFLSRGQSDAKPEKIEGALASAVLYAA